jgi:hypothetical protein
MLADHNPETAEPRLAANIVSFQAHEALARAAAPDMPLSRPLRGSAASLCRGSATAERRLGRLPNASQQPTQPRPAGKPKSTQLSP